MCPSAPAGRLLVVEDPAIRAFVQRALERSGYTTIQAEIACARELLRRGPPRPDLLITNTPFAFLEFAHDLPVLYISSTPDLVLAARFRFCRVLPKPFTLDDLLASVVELAGPPPS